MLVARSKSDGDGKTRGKLIYLVQSGRRKQWHWSELVADVTAFALYNDGTLCSQSGPKRRATLKSQASRRALEAQSSGSQPSRTSVFACSRLDATERSIRQRARQSIWLPLFGFLVYNVAPIRAECLCVRAGCAARPQATSSLAEIDFKMAH